MNRSGTGIGDRPFSPVAFADPVVHGVVVGEELSRACSSVSAMWPGRVDADRQRRLAELGEGLVVELDVGGEAARVAADDGEREREAVAGGPHDRFGAAADADPGASGGARPAGNARPSTGGRRCPPWTGWPALGSRGGEQGELLLEQVVVVLERVAEQRERLGERARPRITSARPLDSASRVEKRWKTRTGSSVLRTVTAVRARSAGPGGDGGQDDFGGAMAKSARWCSPTPKKSMPSWSASAASARTSRRTAAWGSGWPSGSRVTSPKVSRPRSMLDMVTEPTAARNILVGRGLAALCSSCGDKARGQHDHLWMSPREATSSSSDDHDRSRWP